MFNLGKQANTKLEVNKLWLLFGRCLSLRSAAPYLGLFLYVLGFLGATISWQLASAQPFNSASTTELRLVCGGTKGALDVELSATCTSLGGSPQSSGAGSQSQPNSILISQQQLKDVQTSKEKEDIVVPGGSADILTAQWGEKFSTFLTAGATTLTHNSNAFEEGYTATIPSVTLGGGYLISENLEAGLAFNYSNSDGDYITGGGFEVDSYSPLLYINYLPFNNAFTSLALSYTQQERTNNRIAVINDGGAITRFSTSSDLSTNQYNLNFLSGYDLSVENFTIGPRVGVDVRHWEMDAYQESASTGGQELRYNRQRQTSIQSTLGLSASFAHSISAGVVIPQISASWVHEFANDERTIRAQFVQATNSSFSFLTERPARNWAVIDFGISLMMQNGIQAFANFSTVQGNHRFESYGGNLGIRVGW